MPSILAYRIFYLEEECDLVCEIDLLQEDPELLANLNEEILPFIIRYIIHDKISVKFR